MATQRELILSVIHERPVSPAELRSLGVTQPACRVWELRRVGWPILRISADRTKSLYVLQAAEVLTAH
ncbi:MULTISPECIES: helix-turn-helix domain-containing protein [Nitrosomonas]|uniref:helix-turn-helix domain-containing protein n=1 Tax=Nitrosomonas TaxID=914 RepID=UPI00338EC0CC